MVHSSIASDVLATHLLPRSLPRPEVGGISAEAGSATFCWVVAGGQLHLWQPHEGREARLRSLRLPGPVVNSSIVHIAVLTARSALTVVLCSASGTVATWLDANLLSEPMVQQVVTSTEQGAAVAFAAAASELSDGPGFTAALAAADGSLHLLQGSRLGIHAKLLSAPAPARPQAQGGGGMLSAITSAVSYAYNEAFAPGQKYLKRSPSGRPVRRVHMSFQDATHAHVLALTDTTLDCWLITFGLRPAQQLLWCYHNVLAAQSEQRLASPSNVGMSVSGGQVAILLQDQPGTGAAQAYVHLLNATSDSMGPVHEYCLPVHNIRPEGTLSQWTLSLSPAHGEQGRQTVLLASPRCRVYEWAPGPSGGSGGSHHHQAGTHAAKGSNAVLLSDDPDNVAAAPVSPAHAQAGRASALAISGSQPVWLLLSATYGVLELGSAVDRLQASSAAEAEPGVQGSSGAAAARSTGPLTVEQKQQVHLLLDSVIAQASSATAAKGSTSSYSTPAAVVGVAAGLRRRLEGLGALSSQANMSVIAEYSTGIVDMLPKQWALGGVTGPAGSHSSSLLASLLSEKEGRHNLLLMCLYEASVLHGLPASVLRVLVENAEKLAVAQSLLSQHLQSMEDAAAAGSTTEPLIAQAVADAGRAAMAGSSSSTLTPTELFYAQPSLCAPQLLQALGRAASSVCDQAGSGMAGPGSAGASALRSHVLDIGRTLGTVVSAALTRREALLAGQRLAAASLYTSLGTASWMADPPARDALDKVALAWQAVRRLLLSSTSASSATSLAPQQLELAQTGFAVTEVLLNAYAAAVAAAPTLEAKQAVLRDYRAARSRCAEALLQDALLEAGGSQAQQQQQQLPPGLLMWQVEALAAAHHIYPQLFDTCEAIARLSAGPGSGAIGGNPRLHQHMMAVEAEPGAGELDTFARYCYQRFLDEGRPADLLQLPSWFTRDLVAFLDQSPEHAGLLWPLLLRTADSEGSLGAAAAAVMQDAQAHTGKAATHRRLLAVAKLSCFAAGDAAQAAQVSTELRLISVQARLQALTTGNPSSSDLLDGPVMDVPSLVDTALAWERSHGDGQGALLAIEALSVCSPASQQANQSRLQQAWQQVLLASDWASISSGTDMAGVSGTYKEVLQKTPLYKAVCIAHTAGALGLRSAARDSAPLQQLQTWLTQWTAGDTRAQAFVLQAAQLAVEVSEAANSSSSGTM